MQILLTKTPVTQLEADAVVIGQFAGSSPTGVAVQIDNASAGALTRLMEAGEITGKQGELVPMLAMGGVRTRQVLIVGLGEESQFDAGRALQACSAAARHLASKPRPRVAFCFDDTWTLEHQQAGICGIQMGCQGQDLYRAEKQRHPFSDKLFVADAAYQPNSVRPLLALGNDWIATDPKIGEFVRCGLVGWIV